MGEGGWVVKTNWQNLLGGLIKFLSWHNWSPLTLPSHPTQATDDDRSLKKVRECRAGVGFSEPAYVNLCGCALIGFRCRFLSDCTRDAARVIWKDLYLLLPGPVRSWPPFLWLRVLFSHSAVVILFFIVYVRRTLILIKVLKAIIMTTTLKIVGSTW